MARLTWDSEQEYEFGVSNGVLYPASGSPGVEWNGLISVQEHPDASTISPFYLDGQKISAAIVRPDYSASLTAFRAPDGFSQYEGLAEVLPGFLLTNQVRPRFGLSYRTNSGEDSEKLHLVYNVLATTTKRGYSTVGSVITPGSLEWKLTSIPLMSDTNKPAAHFVIDMSVLDQSARDTLEDTLWGYDGGDPTLPDPTEIISVIVNADYLVITDNGDGTWTAVGPTRAISMLDDHTFEIDWATAVPTSDTEYTLSTGSEDD